MRPAVAALLAAAAIFLLFDALAWSGVVPGDTVSQAVRAAARAHPLRWRGGYVALAGLLYLHFFS